MIFCIIITQIFIFIKEGGIIVKKSLLKIPNGNQKPQIEAARRDNAMVKSKKDKKTKNYLQITTQKTKD